MTETETIQLFKCLADATRLEMLRALSQGPKYVELLSERLQRSPSTISFHLKKLEEVGLVETRKEQYYVVASLKEDVLKQSLLSLVCPADDALDVQALREMQYREKVLQNHFAYGKLKTIPVQRKKRRIVLEKLLESFEKGRQYTEKEVNLILADFNDDFCTLRREMIAENLMERDHGTYWVK